MNETWTLGVVSACCAGPYVSGCCCWHMDSFLRVADAEARCLGSWPVGLDGFCRTVALPLTDLLAKWFGTSGPFLCAYSGGGSLYQHSGSGLQIDFLF